MRIWIVPLVVLVAIAAAVVAADERTLVAFGEHPFGKVWVNLSLTHLRYDEPFLPMVVGLQNQVDRKVVVERRSMRLVGPDGSRYPMAGLKEIRSDYDKLGLDRRVVSAAGIPLDLWRSQRRLRESNFFPDIRVSRSGTVIDRVVLRRGDGLVDLVYFPHPRGLGHDQPFLLEIEPEGWEKPLRLMLRIK